MKKEKILDALILIFAFGGRFFIIRSIMGAGHNSLIIGQMCICFGCLLNIYRTKTRKK